MNSKTKEEVVKKDKNHYRYALPLNLWKEAKFNNYDQKKFGFFVLRKRVIIAPICEAEDLPLLEFLCFDDKHRFSMDLNVRNFYKKYIDNNYYFTFEKKYPKFIFINEK